ncbi:MAG: ABC transporter substrate-binding protein [Spirochaetaceae bacterium]|jgi:multiple sugar transport system substrate-binding protein|nr:ABC transporter substrate-binding protein [Spirochaetaceae bacterium]
MKKFDVAMICAALAVLFCAIFFYPAKKVNFRQTKLVFSQWLKDDMPEEAVLRIIAEFEEDNPAISIVLEDRSRVNVKNDVRGYLEAVRNEKAGGKNGLRRLPDIILLDPLWLDDSEKSILFWDQNASETQDMAEKTYSTPLYSYFNALFYNIGVLEKAGFDRPPRTWGEFEAVCLKIKEKNIYGLSVGEDFFASIFPWIWPGVYGTLGPDIPRDTFDFTGKNIVESLDFLNRLDRQNALGRPPFMKDEGEKINSFIVGKTAMITASTRLIKRLAAERDGVRFDVTAIPYSENNPARPVFSASGIHAAVLSSSAGKEAALEFVRFLESKRPELAAAAGAVPDGVPVFGGQENAWTPDLRPVVGADNPVRAKALSIFESAESVEEWNIFSACAALGILGGEETALMFRSNRSAADTAAAIQKRYADAVKFTESNLTFNLPNP